MAKKITNTFVNVLYIMFDYLRQFYHKYTKIHESDLSMIQTSFCNIVNSIRFRSYILFFIVDWLFCFKILIFFQLLQTPHVAKPQASSNRKCCHPHQGIPLSRISKTFNRNTYYTKIGLSIVNTVYTLSW